MPNAINMQEETSVLEEPLVFVSCGQFTIEEKELGKQLVALIDEKLKPCKGYFAENQSSLEALSRNVLYDIAFNKLDMMLAHGL